MGFDHENVPRVILDIETSPLPDAAQYLEEPTAPSNYTDPVKIAAYIAKAKAEAVAKCSLDPDLARIVAIGVVEENKLAIATVRTEDEERKGLEVLWAHYGAAHFTGYNIPFDLGMLLRRSLYLDVPAPKIAMDRYKHPQWTDLMELLAGHDPSKRRSLAFYQKRMGLPELVGEGASVPGWVAAGEWDKVENHLRADLVTTAALARKLGVWT